MLEKSSTRFHSSFCMNVSSPALETAMQRSIAATSHNRYGVCTAWSRYGVYWRERYLSSTLQTNLTGKGYQIQYSIVGRCLLWSSHADPWPIVPPTPSYLVSSQHLPPEVISLIRLHILDEALHAFRSAISGASQSHVPVTNSGAPTRVPRTLFLKNLSSRAPFLDKIKIAIGTRYEISVGLPHCPTV